MYWVALSTVILLLLSIGVNHTLALKCYACGSSNTFSDLQNGNPHSCDDFEKSEGEALKRFIIDCPEGYRGCITQKQGDHLMRACDTYAFDDCQSANGITYCYCRGNLCNKLGPLTKAVTSAAHLYLSKISELTDDEDYIDMSGNGDSDDGATDNDAINKDFVKLAASTSPTEFEIANTTLRTTTVTTTTVTTTTVKTTEVTENITTELSTKRTIVPDLRSIENKNKASVISADSHESSALCNRYLPALLIIALLQLLFY